MPTISSPGLGIYNCTFNWFEGLYLYAASATNPSFGIINGAANCVVKGCIINQNNQAAMVGIKLSGTITSGEISGNEIYGGTSSPSASSGAYGIDAGNLGVAVYGNRIRKCRDAGINCLNDFSVIRDNLIYGCAGDGILFTASAAYLSQIYGNTIHNNLGHGINVAGTNGAAYVVIRNNNITSNAQSGKSGINVATSSSDGRRRDWGYNNVWNNTTNYTNVTASATDISVDPGYADAANGDFTPSQSSLKAAFPTSF